VQRSQGGLFLWCTAGEPCWDTVIRLAELGVLVAPGEFYGPAGARHVRVALTASDERIAAAVHRLSRLALP
jgi:aspartate/methionine/tyrosine aminotransferase